MYRRKHIILIHIGTHVHIYTYAKAMVTGYKHPIPGHYVVCITFRVCTCMFHCADMHHLDPGEAVLVK